MAYGKTFVTLLAFSTLATCYTWPDPKVDFIEDTYTVNTFGLGADVRPCSNRGTFVPPESGRQQAAEWVRTAFHDMSTHDVVTGEGGLDASIAFEYHRPENVGNGIGFSVLVLATNTQFVSASDNIALGTVLAVKSCGGPSIPFRIGRVDATGPGPSGVPEPHQDLATHKAAFQRIGFTSEEMIALVACGHTLGGVHEVDFPDIIHGAINSSNTDGIVHFDSSHAVFDNHIASEYVQNSTKNPLVVGFNTTTNSDARIFSSDGNSTIRALAADSAYFQSRCQELLGRMIDTVPKGVELSEPLKPIPVKPNVQLGINSDGKVHVSGTIRIFDSDTDAEWNPSTMPVTIQWKDRSGNECGADCTAVATFNGEPDISFWGNIAFFNFDFPISPPEGISSFVVDWARSATSEKHHADNNHLGFPVQDTVMFIPDSSCFVEFETENGPARTYKIVAAIRNDLELTDGYIAYSYQVFTDGNQHLSSFPTGTAKLSEVETSASPLYTVYQTNLTIPVGTSTFIDVVAVFGEKTYKDSTKSISDDIFFC